MADRSRIIRLHRKLTPLTDDELLHINVFSNAAPLPVTCWKSGGIVTIEDCRACGSSSCRAIHMRRIDSQGNECLPGASNGE